MNKKGQADLIVMVVLFVSGLLLIASVIDAFKKAPGNVFVGASILLAAALVCRAMQWAGKDKS
ncbi:MAG: hypothetical protein L0Y36_01220 [Planctomycetales bacterium]|nr:hypothetical protein [Planctomycetales bacterium]